MGFDIGPPRTPPARRHGDFLRAWQPRETREGRRVERLYDASGRLRAERATAWRNHEHQWAPGALEGAGVAAAIGLFAVLLPAAFVVVMAVVAYLSGALGSVLAIILWATLFGVEGLLISVACGILWVIIFAVVGIFLGPTGGVAAVVVVALLAAMAIARDL